MEIEKWVYYGLDVFSGSKHHGLKLILTMGHENSRNLIQMWCFKVESLEVTRFNPCGFMGKEQLDNLIHCKSCPNNNGVTYDTPGTKSWEVTKWFA